MIGSAAVSVLIGTFVASSVEVTEMVIIVVGVGATRGWRSTWIGAAAGLVVLAGIIAGLGQALQLIPIEQPLFVAIRQRSHERRFQRRRSGYDKQELHQLNCTSLTGA